MASGSKDETTRRTSVAGLTLVEIVVVVAIIGTLAGFAIPNYLDWNRKHKLKEAVGTLHSYINLARMTAMNQNTTVTITVAQTSASSPVTVTFTGTGVTTLPNLTFDTEVSLANAGGGGVGSGVSSPQVVQFTALGRPVNPSTTPSASNNLCITSSGAYTACGATTPQALNFKNTQGINYRIVVTTTGKVSYCWTSSCAQ